MNRIVSIPLSDKPIEEMADPHEQAIVAGLVDGKKCVSFMIDGKPVFSFNEDDPQEETGKRIAEWMRTQPDAACQGWVKLMFQARKELDIHHE